MLFDADVLIWCLRGHAKAVSLVEQTEERALSVVAYMELLRGARDRREAVEVKAFVTDLGFITVPLTENIGHRAAIYVEEYGLRTALDVADALIAATAVETNRLLATGNRKHFALIKELRLSPFSP